MLSTLVEAEGNVLPPRREASGGPVFVPVGLGGEALMASIRDSRGE